MQTGSTHHTGIEQSLFDIKEKVEHDESVMDHWNKLGIQCIHIAKCTVAGHCSMGSKRNYTASRCRGVTSFFRCCISGFKKLRTYTTKILVPPLLKH